jgi:hypothetical protein
MIVLDISIVITAAADELRRGARAHARSRVLRCRRGRGVQFAIQKALDGKAVDWMEKVSDERYRGQPRTR